MTTQAHLIKLRQTSEGFLQRERFSTPVFAFDTLGDQLELSVDKDAAEGRIRIAIRETDSADHSHLAMQLDASQIDNVIEALVLLKHAAEVKA